MNSASMANSSMGGASGVGNYKGVMLCNRPFAGSAVAAKVVPNTDKVSFATGVVPQPVGFATVGSNKEMFKIKRSKKDTVLTKHRKWLADLQRRKDESETVLIQEIIAKEEAKQRFSEHEAKMRALIKQKQMLSEAKESKDSSMLSLPDTLPTQNTNQSQPGSERENIAEAKQESKAVDMAALEKKAVHIEAKLQDKAQAKTTVPSSSSPKALKKPAWALSEKAVDDMTITAEEKGDEEDLLNFAASLDFNKYIDDVEVKAVMDRLRKRITDLEKEVANDDMRDADAAERELKREMLKAMGDAANMIDQGAEISDEDALNYAAKALLEGDEELGTVHSQKSVTALMRAARDQATKRNDPKRLQGQAKASDVYNEPLVVVHDPKEGAHLDAKKDVNKLPYMHRNPAV
jgi:hypothetical protein